MQAQFQLLIFNEDNLLFAVCKATISALLLKVCHSVQYPPEGGTKKSTPQGGIEKNPGLFPVYRG